MTQQMHEQAQERDYMDGEIDLKSLILKLWHGKWLISSITIGGAVFAIFVALLLPNIYRAEALVAPNGEQGAGELSALATQYSGLASLAGVNLASGFTDRTASGLEILKSRKFISEFIDRHDVLVPLLAAKGWDQDTEELQIDMDVFDVSTGKWVRDVRRPRSTIPSLQEAYEEFSEESLSITVNKKTGFLTIAIEHYSPLVAKQWVDWLVQDINSTIMQQDVAEAEQAIKYLEEQIAATPLADLQNVFFRLIEEQTKTVMLAKVSPEYMFRTLDPAVVPERKAKPRRAMIAVLGLILGGILGVAIVLVKDSFSPNRNKDNVIE